MGTRWIDKEGRIRALYSFCEKQTGFVQAVFAEFTTQEPYLINIVQDHHGIVFLIGRKDVTGYHEITT